MKKQGSSFDNFLLRPATIQSRIQQKFFVEEKLHDQSYHGEDIMVEWELLLVAPTSRVVGCELHLFCEERIEGA